MKATRKELEREFQIGVFTGALSLVMLYVLGQGVIHIANKKRAYDRTDWEAVVQCIQEREDLTPLGEWDADLPAKCLNSVLK